MGRHDGHADNDEIEDAEGRPAKGSLVQDETIRYGFQQDFNREDRSKKVIKVSQNLKGSLKFRFFFLVFYLELPGNF